jgi:hypothetical protein
MKCKAKRRDGAKCRANAMRGKNQCFRHSYTTKKQALQASSNGGKAKRQYHRLGNQMKLDTPEDIRKLMAKIFLEAYDKSELELRVEELEKRLNQIEK